MAEENKGKEKRKRVGEGKRRRGGENDRNRGGKGGVFLGDAGSRNRPEKRRKGGSVNEENKGKEENGKEGKRVDEEERGRGGENEKRGRPGGAVFLVMQVLKIPAGGRGFPLVRLISSHVFLLSPLVSRNFPFKYLVLTFFRVFFRILLYSVYLRYLVRFSEQVGQWHEPPLLHTSPSLHLRFLTFTQSLYSLCWWLIETIRPGVIQGLFCAVRLEHLGFSSLHVLSIQSL